jgi:hypothetical protein
VQLHQVELAFANAMHQLDASNGCCRSPEAFKAEHHVRPRFKVAMILFDQLFKYFDDCNVAPSGSNPSKLHESRQKGVCQSIQS